MPESVCNHSQGLLLPSRHREQSIEFRVLYKQTNKQTKQINSRVAKNGKNDERGTKSWLLAARMHREAGGRGGTDDQPGSDGVASWRAGMSPSSSLLLVLHVRGGATEVACGRPARVGGARAQTGAGGRNSSG